jgi:hypothetical protein
MNTSKIILLVTVFCGLNFMYSTEAFSVNIEAKSQALYGNSSGSVTGVGSTYQAAFKNARSKLPKGKSWYKVTTNKKNGKFYVTLYYK